MSQPSRKQSRRSRGFTMLDIVLAIGISLTVTVILAQIVTSATRMAGALNVSTTMQAKVRRSLDLMAQDIQSSGAILPQYTLRTGATVTTSATDTLILRAPSYDSSGSPLAGRYDYIIYRLLRNSTSDGPYILTRIIEADASSARASSTEKTITKNVTSASFSYLTRQTMTGNGLNLTFGLDVAALGVSTSALESLTVNGSPLNVGSSTQALLLGPGLGLPLGALVFLQPPQNNAVIELVYAVAPWLSPTVVNIEQVKVQLSMQNTQIGLGPEKTQSMDLSTSAVLRNR